MEEEHVTLYLSRDILDEIDRSLGQPTLRRKYTQLTDERVAKFLALMDRISTIRESRRQFSRSRVIRKTSRTSTSPWMRPPDGRSWGGMIVADQPPAIHE